MSIDFLCSNYIATKTGNTSDIGAEFQAENKLTCPGCGTIEPRENSVKMPDGCIHHSAIRCGDCDAFLRWGEKPEKQRARDERKQLIKAWLSNPRASLNDWERGFLSSIASAKRISPRQQDWLDRIYSRLGGVA